MSEVADFSFLTEYTPYEGDGSQVLLPFDGSIRVKITKLEKGVSKTSGNQKLRIVARVHEDGVPAGVLYKDIPYTGTRRDGKSNMVGLADFLLSCGWTFDRIQGFAKTGEKLAIDKIVTEILAGDGTAFASVEADEYKNKLRSSITNFITKSRYDQNVKDGVARQPRIGATASNGAASTGTGTAASGPDPLAQMMGSQ